jgi:hypothetical protein
LLGNLERRFQVFRKHRFVGKPVIGGKNGHGCLLIGLSDAKEA